MLGGPPARGGSPSETVAPAAPTTAAASSAVTRRTSSSDVADGRDRDRGLGQAVEVRGQALGAAAAGDLIRDVVEHRDAGHDRVGGVADGGRVDADRAARPVAAVDVDLLAGDLLARRERARQRPVVVLQRAPVAAEAPVRSEPGAQIVAALERLAPDALDLLVAEQDPPRGRLRDDHARRHLAQHRIEALARRHDLVVQAGAVERVRALAPRRPRGSRGPPSRTRAACGSSARARRACARRRSAAASPRRGCRGARCAPRRPRGAVRRAPRGCAGRAARRCARRVPKARSQRAGPRCGSPCRRRRSRASPRA